MDLEGKNHPITGVKFVRKVFRLNGEKVEGVFPKFESKNKDEKDTDTVFTALNVIQDSQMLPFAIDSFGNYICYDIKNQKIVLWEHETEAFFFTEETLAEFLNSLY